MKPQKAEVEALAEVMMTPLSEFITDKEADTHKDPQGLAQKRMFTKAVEAVDEARGERGFWTVVLRFGSGSSTFYQGFGPYPTQNACQKALEGPLAAFESTAYAFVPTRTDKGAEAMSALADEPPAEKGNFGEVRRDAEAWRNGWKGKASRRDNYLR